MVEFAASLLENILDDHPRKQNKIVVAIAIAIAGEFKDSNNFGGFVVFSRGIPT